MIIVSRSQDLQGFNDLLKVELVCSHYKVLIANINALCFQGHHFRSARLVLLKDSIWLHVSFYNRQAMVGFGNNVEQIKGGFWQ